MWRLLSLIAIVVGCAQPTALTCRKNADCISGQCTAGACASAPLKDAGMDVVPPQDAGEDVETPRDAGADVRPGDGGVDVVLPATAYQATAALTAGPFQAGIPALLLVPNDGPFEALRIAANNTPLARALNHEAAGNYFVWVRLPAQEDDTTNLTLDITFESGAYSTNVFDQYELVMHFESDLENAVVGGPALQDLEMDFVVGDVGMIGTSLRLESGVGYVLGEPLAILQSVPGHALGMLVQITEEPADPNELRIFLAGTSVGGDGQTDNSRVQIRLDRANDGWVAQGTHRDGDQAAPVDIVSDAVVLQGGTHFLLTSADLLTGEVQLLVDEQLIKTTAAFPTSSTSATPSFRFSLHADEGTLGEPTPAEQRIDELRIAGKARSEAWIRVEQAALSPTFFNVSPVE